MRKTLIAILALAIAIAFSPIDQLQAATFANPGAQPSVDNVTHTIAAKKTKKKAKKKAKKRKGKKAKSKKGPGKCGAYMYYSKKARKCLDARNKR